MSTQRVVVNPATEETVATIGQIGPEETDEAIDRAVAALPAWRAISPGDRARLLRRFAQVVDGANEELARLEVANSGHTISNARWEAGNVRDVLAYYAGAPERLFGRQIPVPGGVDLTFREPIGVVGIIVPWNFPMPIASWGFVPALAAGNTVVLKPADLTPLTAIRIGELALEAGIPEDVFQVLPGRGSVVGWRFVTHPAVGKVCFTGSTEVGQKIMAGCAEQVKRVTLELGGKSANIVFADADLEAAAASAPMAVFDNAGQDCCARSRHPRRGERLRPVHGALRAGGKGRRVSSTPPTSEARWDPSSAPSSTRHVAAFVPDDAPVAFRGSAPDGAGLLVPADGARPGAAGLAGCARGDLRPGRRRAPLRGRGGRDPHRQRHALRALGLDLDPATSGAPSGSSRAVETGAISVNSNSSVRYWTPFGGFKRSGLGRELGPDALEAFTELKNVFIATS